MARPQPPASTLTRALYSGLCRGARRPCSLPSAQVSRAPPRGSPLVLCALSPGPRAGGRETNRAGLSLASEEAVFGDVPAGRCWHRAHLEGRVPGPRRFTLHRFCSTHQLPLSSCKREQGPGGGIQSLIAEPAASVAQSSNT